MAKDDYNGLEEVRVGGPIRPFSNLNEAPIIKPKSSKQNLEYFPSLSGEPKVKPNPLGRMGEAARDLAYDAGVRRAISNVLNGRTLSFSDFENSFHVSDFLRGVIDVGAYLDLRGEKLNPNGPDYEAIVYGGLLGPMAVDWVKLWVRRQAEDKEARNRMMEHNDFYEAEERKPLELISCLQERYGDSSKIREAEILDRSKRNQFPWEVKKKEVLEEDSFPWDVK